MMPKRIGNAAEAHAVILVSDRMNFSSACGDSLLCYGVWVIYQKPQPDADAAQAFGAKIAIFGRFIRHIKFRAANGQPSNGIPIRRSDLH